MANVKQVVVRFGRKRQPAQYESAEAMIEVTVGADENGEMGEVGVEHVGIGERLLGLVKTLVLRELGVIKQGESGSIVDFVPATAAAPAQTTTAVAPATTRTRKPKEAPAAAVNVPAPPAGGPGENRIGPDDLPEDGSSAPVNSKPTTAAKNDDLPEETATAKPAAKANGAAAAPGLTHADLKSWVVGLLRDGKVAKDTVKAISREFGTERMDDVPVGKLGEYKAKIEAALSASDI